ncbi:MAG: VWA domain-containing protein [Rubrivivax sp.]|nr:VWA domain-containing protein [Pyrinomonadaceae bacterium]
MLHISKRSVSVTLLALLLAIALCSQAQTGATQQGTLEAQAVGAQSGAEQRVSVLFTALGKDKKFVTTLKAEDIRVTADGGPRQVIELKRQTDVPLFLAVAIDASASQERLLPNVRLVGDVFVRGMVLRSADKAAVITFTGDLKIEQEMTADVGKLREAIARVRFVPPPGYLSGGVIISNSPPRNAAATRAASTAMWDAVRYVAGEMMPRSLGAGRRALLLITDGVDTSSHVKPDKAIAAALQSEVAVYSIGVGDKFSFDGVDEKPLRKVAERTGGRAFFPKTVGDLNTVFKQIEEELSSQYVVAFAVPGGARDGSFHKIKVEIVNPQLHAQDIQIAVPQGYYAGNAAASVKQ